MCDASFGEKGTLNYHVATVHEGKKQVNCGICDANFRVKASLNKHVATAHGGKK